MPPAPRRASTRVAPSSKGPEPSEPSAGPSGCVLHCRVLPGCTAEARALPRDSPGGAAGLRSAPQDPSSDLGGMRARNAWRTGSRTSALGPVAALDRRHPARAGQWLRATAEAASRERIRAVSTRKSEATEKVLEWRSTMAGRPPSGARGPGARPSRIRQRPGPEFRTWPLTWCFSCRGGGI